MIIELSDHYCGDDLVQIWTYKLNVGALAFRNSNQFVRAQVANYEQDSLASRQNSLVKLVTHRVNQTTHCIEIITYVVPVKV